MRKPAQRNMLQERRAGCAASRGGSSFPSQLHVDAEEEHVLLILSKVMIILLINECTFPLEHDRLGYKLSRKENSMSSRELLSVLSEMLDQKLQPIKADIAELKTGMQNLPVESYYSQLKSGSNTKFQEQVIG